MKPRIVLVWLLLLGTIGLASALRAADAPATAAEPGLPDGLYAVFGTPRGNVTCELYATKAPLTVASFVGLAEGSLGPAPRKPFFNGLTFHRVVPHFVVQGGDPLGTGEGGPGYSFPDEFSPSLRHDAVGVLSMANDGPDTNGSQFFLTLRPTNFLNYLHSVFGRTVRGIDVLPLIQQGDKMTVTILRIGDAARAFRADDAAFARLESRARTFARPETTGDPTPTAHFNDPDKLLPTVPPRAKKFNQQLANFTATTGVRIVGRIFAKSPPAAEDAKAGEFMRALATKLGTVHRGALFAYFADEDDWRVWIGDESTTAFFGRTPQPAELGEGAAFHQAKEKFLESAKAQAKAEFEQQQALAQPDKPITSGQKLKWQVDAMVEGLFTRLVPAPAVK